ncbi:2Fe-2S iron-sulfur cluster-binding protein [Thiohalomonas denitrificans]|uniref:Truncated hemoglobin YjbI n=1 Tax=Thiohalomonas denitrificans TaxID=415747 RepID=A0A1G5QDJ0_9GAMM|nr:2Fe-2S iron-sulfur cluster-binding protein [Thiohalomonas denitrificans]SCZ59309.1 Truncated hemoglobin YjbI [Thiohalomonas denitrificans]
MTLIEYNGDHYECRKGEVLLDALLRQGADVAFSCRNGICRVCLKRCTEGKIPPQAQQGLAPELCAAGEFMPCRCVPTNNMVITDSAAASAHSAPKKANSGPRLPDPDLWAALGNGVVLRQILEDFYTRVYGDERLSPFFKDTTKTRSVDKQYLFMRQLISGEKVFFGDRPKNGHHWMVISDELFDYRRDLMMECLGRSGLPDSLIARWMQIEDSFRDDIVKSKPHPKVIDGMEQPLDGFGEETLDVGSLCDACGEEIDPGVTVRYHLRLGTIYCPTCAHLTPTSMTTA